MLLRPINTAMSRQLTGKIALATAAYNECIDDVLVCQLLNNNPIYSVWYGL